MKLLQFAIITKLALALPQSRGSSGSINPKTGQPTGWPGFLATLDFTKATTNDVTTGACRDIFLIVARGSTEPGNIGVTTGPMLCDFLRAAYGDRVGCQGVDPKGYLAALTDNFKASHTAEESIVAGVKEFTNAYEKCPKSRLVFTGYSQGAALMHNVIPRLSEAVRNQVVAGILFGDTMNKQTSATIEGFPKENLLSICAEDDGVCWGALQVTAGHVVYTQNGDVEKAANFLISKINTTLQRPT